MLAYLFVILAVAARALAGTGTLSLHGFTPLCASLIFFGSRAPRKQFWAPVALLIGCDVYLNIFRYNMAITWDQTVIWAWYGAVCFSGLFLRGRVKPLWVGAAAIGSSVSFFVISNFAVWLAGNIAYPKTLAGLSACYVAAIPFFKNDLISNLLFSTVFFAIPALISSTRGTAERKRATA
jgi:hypothetical protein